MKKVIFNEPLDITGIFPLQRKGRYNLTKETQKKTFPVKFTVTVVILAFLYKYRGK